MDGNKEDLTGVEPCKEQQTWRVITLESFEAEAEMSLNERQIQHLTLQMRDLALEVDPTKNDWSEVISIEEIFALVDFGGVLGGKQVSIFFGLDTKGAKDIVLIGVIAREFNGPTSPGDKLTMRRRWRKYMEQVFK